MNFYVNHEHRENYEALLIYYKNSIENPIVDGACYILALPEIFNSVDVFESELPFSWVYDENGITETITQYSITIIFSRSSFRSDRCEYIKPSGY